MSLQGGVTTNSGASPAGLDVLRAALNTVGVTPSAREVLAPYEQAFRSSPEARATVEALTRRARHARVRGLSQAQIGRRAGVVASTVSEVVERLRRLDLVETTGGEYLISRRRNALLRYHLRWSPVIELSEGRMAQARYCAESLAAGVSVQQIRSTLARGFIPAGGEGSEAAAPPAAPPSPAPSGLR
jgi:hypothetical protein